MSRQIVSRSIASGRQRDAVQTRRRARTRRIVRGTIITVVGLVILREHLHARDNIDRALIAAAALAMLVGLVSLARSRAAQIPPTETRPRAMSNA